MRHLAANTIILYGAVAVAWFKVAVSLGAPSLVTENAVDQIVRNWSYVGVTAKNARAPQGFANFYFARDIGVLLKWINFDPNERVTSTRTVQSYSLNVEIPADRFTFSESSKPKPVSD